MPLANLHEVVGQPMLLHSFLQSGFASFVLCIRLSTMLQSIDIRYLFAAENFAPSGEGTISSVLDIALFMLLGWLDVKGRNFFYALSSYPQERGLGFNSRYIYVRYT